jgi:hypothetical protein
MEKQTKFGRLLTRKEQKLILGGSGASVTCPGGGTLSITCASGHNAIEMMLIIVLNAAVFL